MQDKDWLDLQNTSSRHILDLGANYGTHLRVLGHYHYDKAMPPVPKQQSEQRLVIAILLSGLQYYKIDADTRMLRGGQGIRFLSGVTYSSDNFPEQRGEMVWLTIDRPKSKTFTLPGLTNESALDWWKKISSPDYMRRFPVSSSLRERLHQSLVLSEQCSSSIEHSEFLISLGMVLIEIYRCIGLDLNDSVSPSVHDALKWVEENLGMDDFNVEELASKIGLSTSRFYTRFKEEIGLTPSDYLLRRKVLESQRRLLSGNSITEVAMDLGFSSSQYFATVFKRYTRMTPSAWILNHKHSSRP